MSKSKFKKNEGDYMKIVKGIVTIFVSFLYWLLYQLWFPTLSLAYFDGFIFIGIGVIALAALLGWWAAGDNGGYVVKFPKIAIIAFIVVLLGGLFVGSALFNSSTMYNQLGKIDEKSFENDIVELDTSQIPVVDLELAAKLADKKLGEDLALGSQMKVGKFTNKQQVNGKLVYVAPLEHRGFWKWLSNKFTTGYVIVSATNPNDVQLVRTVNDEPIKLQYLSSSYFGSDLVRHLRNSGYRTTGLTEFSFELDDTGKPYWVVTTYENTTLWGNPEATGVVVCDPQSGECNWYSVADAPEWVDIIQPESFIIDQIKHYGEYVHGVWNFSDRDKLSMTEHMTTVYNEGDCFYYTGMSSVGEDNGTVGFVMVNTRDKSVKMYRMVGATEEAAMRSAEGKVQNMGYTATTPIPLNVSGIPTYFCTLKDAEGLVKQYAMLSIKDYSIVASGTTVMEAKRAFVNAVNNSGTAVDFGNEAYGYTLTGVVTRIGSNIESGDTYYYMVLDDDDTKLYLASYMISEELPITHAGDTVEISYVDESNGTINIVSFDNIKFAQEISEAQQRLNEEQEANNLINNPDSGVIKVDPEANQETWDNLTDEEKAKLLDELLKDGE